MARLWVDQGHLVGVIEEAPPFWFSFSVAGSRKSPPSIVDRCISKAARHVSPYDRAEAKAINVFLHMGEDGPNDVIPEGNVLEWMRGAQVRKKRRIAALWHLFYLLARYLPAEARETPSVTAEAVEDIVRPMVDGLIQPDWREVALRELGRRVFVLDHDTTMAAMKAEISTGWIGEAWRVFWLYFEDYGLAPRGLKLAMDGVSAGTFAHVRPSARKKADPYCDVVGHEAAHLLHYLKPENFELSVRRGQERFLDVRFDSRELFAFACEAFSQVLKAGDRKARLAFAERMREDATSFPKNGRKRFSELVLAATRSRNGWKVIRETVVEKRRSRSQPGKLSLEAKS